jgi:type II secretory pathway pseudopilin PulG
MIRWLRRRDDGYAMAALLVGLSVMGIILGMVMPVWQTWARREREAELVFRGEQYVQAIGLFSRQTGGFPTSMNALRDGRYIRRLYKDPITNQDFQPVYLGQVASGAIGAPTAPGGRVGGIPGRGQQPATGRGAAPPTQGRGTGTTPQGGRAGQSPFGPAAGTGAQGAGPIIGVVSRSTAESLRQYNGRGRYNEWLFVSTAATQQPGGPAGTQTPGVGGPGRQGGPGRGLPGRGAPGRGRL